MSPHSVLVVLAMHKEKDNCGNNLMLASYQTKKEVETNWKMACSSSHTSTIVLNVQRLPVSLLPALEKREQKLAPNLIDKLNSKSRVVQGYIS